MHSVSLPYALEVPICEFIFIWSQKWQAQLFLIWNQVNIALLMLTEKNNFPNDKIFKPIKAHNPLRLRNKTLLTQIHHILISKFYFLGVINKESKIFNRRHRMSNLDSGFFQLLLPVFKLIDLRASVIVKCKTNFINQKLEHPRHHVVQDFR